MFNRLLALLLLIFFSPLFLLLYVMIKLMAKGAFLYTQERTGKGMKPFIIYKMCTMIPHAEEIKKKYIHLNEYHPPLFKIKNDPRYTKIGRFLAHYSIDELPQLINIIRGEMVFVGPRPLPVAEAFAVPKKYGARFTVLPGIIPPWIIKGHGALKSDRWLELDLEYVKEKSFKKDVTIFMNCIKNYFSV